MELFCRVTVDESCFVTSNTNSGLIRAASRIDVLALFVLIRLHLKKIEKKNSRTRAIKFDVTFVTPFVKNISSSLFLRLKRVILFIKNGRHLNENVSFRKSSGPTADCDTFYATSHRDVPSKHFCKVLTFYSFLCLLYLLALEIYYRSFSKKYFSRL